MDLGPLPSRPSRPEDAVISHHHPEGIMHTTLNPLLAAAVLQDKRFAADTRRLVRRKRPADGSAPRYGS